MPTPTPAPTATSEPEVASRAPAWLAGFAAGSLVNALGVAAWVSGPGPTGYWLPVLVAAVLGLAAAITHRLRWLGLGLASGCVAEALVLVGLVVAWGSLAGSAVP